MAAERLEFCRSLPKAELHAHLHGSIRKSTALELLEADGTSTPEKHKLLTDTAVNIDTAFPIFGIFHSVVTNVDRVYRITKETLEDYDNDNTRYMEIRTTPRGNENMTKDEYLQAVCKGIKEHQGQLDTRLLISVNRGLSLEEAAENIRLASAYDLAVGLDFSGNPKAANFGKFRELFDQARTSGWKITIHTGEIEDEIDTDMILDFKPDRLGHINVLTEAQKAIVMDNKIPAEMCPSSNKCTMEWDSFQQHHFGVYYPTGHPIIICADDTGLLDTTLSEEYAHIADAFSLSDEEISDLAKKSFEYVFSKS